ncbi:MAG: DUF3592 domain-containing protein [Bacteroidota bacterium]
MRSQFFFFGIFAAIGVPCFLLAAYFTFSSVQKIITRETAEGVINGYDDTSYPLVNFDYQGKSYSFGSSYKGDDIHEGDAVTIIFPPNEPQHAEIDSFFSMWFLPVFLSIFGVCFGGVGVYGITREIKKRNAKNELFIQQRGKKLSLPFILGRNMSYSVNKVHPYIIKSTWTDPISNIKYDFTSENLWQDPSPAVSEKKHMDVYIDESDPRRYYMDVTFLV